MGKDHGFLNTKDGLSEEDHKNGYHYYGGYKVMHVCKTCNQKRPKFGYDWGWTNTLTCNFCNAKDIAKKVNFEYSADITEAKLWSELNTMYKQRSTQSQI